MDWTHELEFRRIRGVDVELASVVPEGWTWRFSRGRYVVVGPDDRSWKPTAKRIVHFVSYLSGSVVRTLDDGSIELVTWRDHDNVGFRVQFVREGAHPIETKA